MRNALRKGRTVVIALVENDRQAGAAREALTQAGVESIDAARESWWIGLRDVEKEEYKAHGGDFETDELSYRRGFEAALQLETRVNRMAMSFNISWLIIPMCGARRLSIADTSADRLTIRNYKRNIIKKISGSLQFCLGS